MTAQHVTTINPRIRVQPEVIFPGRLTPLPADELPTPLFVRSGDAFSEAPDSIIINSARRLIDARFTNSAPILACSELLHDFLHTRLGALDHEAFAIILLDVQHRLIEYVELFHGGVEGASIYPREVVKWVVATRASKVVLVHNHPSGCSEPSLADRAVTQRLRQALKFIDVKLTDHLIVGKTITSMKDRGLLS
jgi:DNA repair protein RadC